MPTPSLCGNFLTNKRSLIAFTWTLTTVFTLVAFVVALALTIHTHVYYSRVYSQRRAEYEASQRQEYENENQNQQQQQHGGRSADHEWERFRDIAQMNSRSITFVAMYTMSMAVTLSLYGSTAIVGFTSLRGVYIAPCFSYPSSSKLKVGIFGGAIIFFANLLLVCAVVFGEVRVVDTSGENNGEAAAEQQENNREKYEIEKIATILAVTCMFLSALYTIFAILLFLYYGSEGNGCDNLDYEAHVGVTGGVVVKKSSNLLGHSNDPRRENFITMGSAVS